MVEYLKRVGGQRGSAPEPNPSSWVVTFAIHLPDDFPGEVPYPHYFIGDRLYHQGISWQEFGFVAGVEYAPAPHHSPTVYTYLGHEPRTNLEKERQTAVALSREC